MRLLLVMWFLAISTKCGKCKILLYSYFADIIGYATEMRSFVFGYIAETKSNIE